MVFNKRSDLRIMGGLLIIHKVSVCGLELACLVNRDRLLSKSIGVVFLSSTKTLRLFQCSQYIEWVFML